MIEMIIVDNAVKRWIGAMKMNILELEKKIATELFGLRYRSDYSTRGIPVIGDDNQKLVL